MRNLSLLALVALMLFMGGCKKEKLKPAISNVNYTLLNCQPPYNVIIWYEQDASTVNGDEKALWNFGDGTTSTILNSVAKTFDSTGVYNVTVEVENANGKGTSSLVLNLSAPSYQIVSSFNANGKPYTGCEVTFTNTSKYAVSYLWDFGDGTTSSTVSPKHSYTNTGSYAVKLKAICSGDTITSTKNIVIQADPASFELYHLALKLPVSNLDSDTDDSDARPDYYLKVYVDGSFLLSTPVIENVASFPTSWYTINHQFTIHSSSEKITFEIWDWDKSGNDDYLGNYYFNTGWLKDNCFPGTINWTNDELSLEVVYH